jgi:hypothetical protein
LSTFEFVFSLPIPISGNGRVYAESQAGGIESPESVVVHFYLHFSLKIIMKDLIQCIHNASVCGETSYSVFLFPPVACFKRCCSRGMLPNMNAGSLVIAEMPIAGSRECNVRVCPPTLKTVRRSKVLTFIAIYRTLA